MGNVLAAAAPPGFPAPPMGAPPPPPTAGTGVPPPPPPPTSVPVEEPPANPNDPGSFEDLHKKCKEVFPMTFEGGKVLINKGLSNHFQISHTITMSSIQPSGYKFGTTYVGTKQFGPMEVFPVMVGEIDPSGNMNANIIHQFHKRVRCKFMSQIQKSQLVTSQLTTEYKGDDCQAAVTLGNIDLVNESGIIVNQYLQSISDNLALGAELLYQYGPSVPYGQIGIYTLAGRYSAKTWQLSANLCPSAMAAHACYYHRLNDQLSVGLELEGSGRLGECTTTAAYQMEIPATNMTIRGQVDTNLCFGAVLEKKLLPLPFTLMLSGYANHFKSMYRFGIGLTVG